MKKLFLALSLLTTSAFAQSNYFALISSNTYIHGISKATFTAGNATYTDTTNIPVLGFGGYKYPSNFNGTTKWTFPSSIIIGTNALLSVDILTTNTATVIAGTYRMVLYTNGNLITPFYDSSDITWIGTVATFNTNLETISITNVVPTNAVNNTNISLCTFGVKIGPVVGDWFTSWITGGQIHF